MRKNREFALTLNGKLFRIDETGDFAIATDGRMVRLADRPKESRFR